MKRILWPAILVLTGCAGHQQSVLDPAGAQADRIAQLWWFFFWLLSVIFVLVIGVMLAALTRKHRGINQEPLGTRDKPSEQTESGLKRVVGAATVLTVAILLG